MTDAPALASAAALARLLDAEAAARADLEGDYGGRCRALQPLLDALRETWEQWEAAEADGEEDPEAAATRIQQWWWGRRGQRGVRQHRRRPSQQSIASDADEPRPQYMRTLRTPSVQLQRLADAPAGGPRSWWVVAPDSPTAAQFPAGELTVEEDVGRVNTEAEERAARRQLWAAHGQAWDRLLRFAARRAAAEAAAAVTVQRFTRRWVTGAAQRRRHVRRAAVACEARREAEEHQMAAEDEASQALLRNGQAAVLQRAWRQCQRRLRRQARTATRLQAWWRAAVGRRRWPALQDHLEGLRTLERTEALERKWAAREEAAARAVLPLSRTDLRAVPGYAEAMAATLALRRRAWAAVRLQAAWRGRAARREAAARRAAWRGRAAPRLQAVARGWAVRRWLPALRAAAEAEARRRLEGQWRLQTAAERRRAARVVQRAWRRHCSGAKPLWEARTPLPGRPAAFRARPSAQAQANAADRQFALRQQQDTARRGVERLEAEEWQRLLDRIALGWAAPRLPERARGPAAQRRWAAAVRLQAACRGWRVRRRMPCSFADLLGERDTMARAEQFARRELEREEAAARRALPSSPAAVAAWLRAATPATPAGPLAQTWTAGLSASTAAPPPAPTPATLPPLPRPALRPPPPLPVPEPAWERPAVRATAVAPLPAGAPTVSAAELEDAYGRRAAPLWPGRPLDAAPIRPLGTVLQRQRQKVVARSHALPRRIDAIS